MKKRIGAVVLCFCMALSLVPLGALAEGDAVAKIGNQGYPTLAAAFAAINDNTQTTIEVLADSKGAGIVVPSGRNITVNFNQHSYTVNQGPGAGSAGTQNQVFQLLKDSTIVFNDGLIAVGEENANLNTYYRVIQNYSNLTLNNMEIRGENLRTYNDFTNSVIESDNGVVALTGTTKILDVTGGTNPIKAINVDAWDGAYPDGTQLTVNLAADGQIGTIHCFTEGAGTPAKSTLTITSGKVDGLTVAEGNTVVVTKAEGAAVTSIPEGQTWVETEVAGTYRLATISTLTIAAPEDTQTMLEKKTTEMVTGLKVAAPVKAEDEAAYDYSVEVTGMALPINGWAAFSSAEAEQNGYFLPLKLTVPSEMTASAASVVYTVGPDTDAQQYPIPATCFTGSGDYSSTPRGDNLVMLVGAADAAALNNFYVVVDWDGDGVMYTQTTYLIQTKTQIQGTVASITSGEGENEVTTYYTTIQDAVNAAKSNDTVYVLGKDTTLVQGKTKIEVSKALTIDESKVAVDNYSVSGYLVNNDTAVLKKVENTKDHQIIFTSVATIGEKGYSTIQGAVDAASKGDTIVLKRYIDTTEAVTVNKAITIVLPLRLGEGDNENAGTAAQNYTGENIKAANGFNKEGPKEGQEEGSRILEFSAKPSTSGGGGGVAQFGVSVADTTNGTVKPDKTSAAKDAKVTLTVKPDEGYKLDKLTVKDSSDQDVTVTDNGDGTYTFTMPAAKVTVTATFVKDGTTPADSEKFVDVPKDAYYHDAVYWAVDKGITEGVDATHFAPDATCTRAQMVTFLWRDAGQPAPTSSENPFTDVKEGAYYYDAVLWAVEKGITVGTSSTTFSPDDTVIRGQAVTFLWRYEGKPAPTATENPFTDVTSSDYFYQPVLWAVETNVTAGTSKTTFSPKANCLRSQVVTFLYRAAGQE